MTKHIRLTLLALLILSTPALSQVSIGGTIDAGISSGGSGSAFISNGISHDYRHLGFRISQVNLLLFAPVNDNWYFEGRLQSDTWGEGTLRTPRFTLANLTWDNPEKAHTVSIGRFITPFGFYPTRSLTIDRTFIELPLAYSYYIAMSDEYGYWDEARYALNYQVGGGLMTTTYFGGYSTGLRWDWNISENELMLQTAISAVSLGSSRNYTNLPNAAGTARLVYNPNIQWQIGLSASYGSFMHLEVGENDAEHENNPLTQYRQTLAGFDFRYGLGYWEVIGEVIYSNWKVPTYYESAGGWVFEADSTTLKTSNYSNIGMNLDLRFEPPFVPGSYIGFRLDHLNFIEAHPTNSNIYDTEDWDKDKVRYSLALGYKLARNVELKMLLSEQTPYDYSLYTFRALITAFF